MYISHPFFPSSFPPSLTLPCGLRLAMRGTLSPIVLNSSIVSWTPALCMEDGGEGGGERGEGVDEGGKEKGGDGV